MKNELLRETLVGLMFLTLTVVAMILIIVPITIAQEKNQISNWIAMPVFLLTMVGCTFVLLFGTIWVNTQIGTRQKEKEKLKRALENHENTKEQAIKSGFSCRECKMSNCYCRSNCVYHHVEDFWAETYLGNTRINGKDKPITHETSSGAIYCQGCCHGNCPKNLNPQVIEQEIRAIQEEKRRNWFH